MSSLSVAQVRAILRECSDANVTLLKWGNLQVEFGPKRQDSRLQNALPPTVAKEIAATQEKISETAHVQDEIALREQQIAMAVLEDPVLGEELLIQGELEDGGSEDEEDA